MIFKPSKSMRTWYMAILGDACAICLSNFLSARLEDLYDVMLDKYFPIEEEEEEVIEKASSETINPEVKGQI
jgi:hypothetical protein